MNRVRDDLKREMRWLKDKGMNADNAKEFMKRINQSARVLDESFKNPQESAEELVRVLTPEVGGGSSKKEPAKEKEPEAVKASLMDFPTRMAYNVALRSSGALQVEDLTESELVSR